MVSEAEIIEVLKQASSTLKAKDIAAKLRAKTGNMVDKSSVNSVLYRLKSEGVAIINDKFGWTLAKERPRAPNPEHDEKQSVRRETLYDVLQVAPQAHPDVISKAYKALAMLYHPDRVDPKERPHAEERMKAINAAYGILSDTMKRSEYDVLIGIDRMRQ